MWYFLYLAVFLACSASVHGEKCSNASERQQEYGELTESLQNVVMGVYENSTWKLPYKCCMCKESLKLARLLMITQIQEKADNICSIIKSARDQCLSKAKLYQDKVIRVLFPGGPNGICKSLKICK